MLLDIVQICSRDIIFHVVARQIGVQNPVRFGDGLFCVVHFLLSSAGPADDGICLLFTASGFTLNYRDRRNIVAWLGMCL